MNRLYDSRNKAIDSLRGRSSGKGFTLPEFVIAMAIFMIVGGAAFSLFNQQQKSFTQEVGQSGLNIGLRNAMSMVQMDTANAASGVLPGANIPGFPVGVTFTKPPAGTCHTNGTTTYSASCFAKLNIIEADSAAVPIHASDSGGLGLTATGSCSLTNTGSFYGSVLGVTTAAGTALTPAAAVAQFPSGTQVLFLSSDGSKMTTAVLTSNSTSSGNAVLFHFNTTAVSGLNTAANDPLEMTTTALTNTVVTDTVTDTLGFTDRLSNQFCGPDWVIKLAPITYQVDTSNAANPILTRTQRDPTTNTVVTNTVMEQIVGFRVGASIWNDGAGGVDTTLPLYYYDPASFPTNANDFSQVRSLRVSVIARTTPNTNPVYRFRNGFDQGPYQILGDSVVITPRNLSMND